MKTRRQIRNCAAVLAAIAPLVLAAGGQGAAPLPRLQPRTLCGDGHCAGSPGENFGTCPEDCASLEDRSDYLKDLLQSTFEGMDEGLLRIFNPEDCANTPVCFYNNPTSPYGQLLFPLAPGEPDPDPLNLRASPPDMEHLYSGHRLQPHEAIVWVGRTPPESPYFSFTAYVFSRFNPAALGNSPYWDRAVIFASLGESENQVTMKTSAQPGEPPFDQESVVIVTADRTADSEIREVLAAAGFSESVINTLVIPRFQADGLTPKAFMGYDNEADLFAVLMRIAHSDAQQPGTPIRAWLDNPGARVFRVRPAAFVPLDPFPLPEPRPQGNGESERSATLDELVRRIRVAHSGYQTLTRIAWPLQANGDFCLDNLTQCNGDCRDTPYMSTTFTLGPEPEAIIVAGRNHERSGKASYVNVTATRVIDRTAYYSIVMPELEGSAAVYLPHHPDAANLWQMKFARNCNGEPYCYELSEQQIPIGGVVAILVRAYLDPSTGTTPKASPISESELVFPRVIKVK